MIGSQNLFREYILLRSRMVTYVAIAILIFLLIGLVAWFVVSPQNINRFGLLLQLLGVLALAPHVFGKDKIPFLRRAGAVVKGGAGAATLGRTDPEVDPQLYGPALHTNLNSEEQILTYYQDNNLAFLLGNILAAGALVWTLMDVVLRLRPGVVPTDGWWRLFFSLLGFIWIDLYMLLQIYRLRGFALPRVLLAWFFIVDFFISVLGIFFAALVHILVAWAAGGFRFIFNNGMRRVLLIVTIPFLAVGLFFELVATF
jgi:hypothetical protein